MRKRLNVLYLLLGLALLVPHAGVCADGDPVLLPVTRVATVGTDHTSSGPVCTTINAGESVTIMDCVYLKSDGEFWKTDADAAVTASGMLAISLESQTDGNAMDVALSGSFVRDDTWDWTIGGVIYLDTETAGGLTQTAPSGTDDVVRVVGHAVTADIIFFDPDQTVIVHE